MFQIHIEAISMPDSRLNIIRAPERAGKQWPRDRPQSRRLPAITDMAHASSLAGFANWPMQEVILPGLAFRIAADLMRRGDGPLAA
jgi:hypothetical protein